MLLESLSTMLGKCCEIFGNVPRKCDGVRVVSSAAAMGVGLMNHVREDAALLPLRDRGTDRPLNARQVLQLLQRDVDAVGGQSEWARRAGIDRSLLNKILSEKRSINQDVTRCLSLRRTVCYMRMNSGPGSGDPAKILEIDDVLDLLSREVEDAGGQENWTRRTNSDRTFLNKVLRRHKAPGPTILQFLNLTKVIGYVPVQTAGAAPETAPVQPGIC